MKTTEQIIRECAARSNSKFDLWIHFLKEMKGVQYLAEVGVYRGKFASTMIKDCDSIIKYYMIDPWRHLDDWNKPFNKDDDVLEQCLEATKMSTDFAASKRIILS